MKKLLFFLLFFTITAHCQDGWINIKSPCGGDALRIFKVTDSIYLAGLRGSSIYRSTDRGRNWEKVFSNDGGSTFYEFGTFCMSPSGDLLAGIQSAGILRSTDNGLSWIATGKQGGTSIIKTASGMMVSISSIYYNLSLSKSLDSGKTWIDVTHPSSLNPYGNIQLASFGDEIYIENKNFIYVSSDSCMTYNKYGIPFSSDTYINEIIPLSRNVLYAVTNKGLYYTNDRGATWIEKNNGFTSSSFPLYGMQLTNDGLFIYGKNGLYFSKDSAASWSHYNGGHYSAAINSAAVDKDNILVATSSGIFKVVPEKWISSSEGIRNYQVSNIYKSSNDDIIAGTSVGLFKLAPDSESWEILGLDKFSGDYWSFCMKDSIYLVQVKNRSFYRSTDYGNTWTHLFDTDFNAIPLAFSSYSGKLYSGFLKLPISSPHGTPHGYFSYSSNNGSSWIEMNSNVLAYLHIVILPGDTLISTIDDINIYGINIRISTDNGKTWSPLNNGLPPYKPLSESYPFLLCKDENNNVYTRTSNRIYKLNSRTKTWQQFSSALPYSVNVIKCDRSNNLILMHGKSLRITRDGNIWHMISLPATVNTLIDFIRDSRGYLYAVDSYGQIFRKLSPNLTNSLPASPQLLSPSMGQAVPGDTVKLVWKNAEPLVNSYTVRYSADSSFSEYTDIEVNGTSLAVSKLTSNKNYYWKVKAKNESGESEYSSVSMFYTGTTSSKYEPVKVFSYALRQNYPNPFNPVTNISYSLAKAGEVEVKVFNVLGMETMTLVNGFENEGDHTIKVDASLLPSGVYFYRIKSGNFTDIKKMVLLK